MKRVAVIIILILLAFQLTAYGEEISEKYIESTDKIYKDRITMFSSITIGEKTFGDVVSIMGDLNIENEVNGDIVAVFGDVRVNSKVSGDVVVVMGKVILTDRANVSMDVISIGSIEKMEGALIGGDEVSVAFGDFNGNGITRTLAIIQIIIMIVQTFFILILGLILVTALKDKFGIISLTAFDNIARKTSIGFLALLGLTVISVLLFITVLAPLAFFVILVVSGVAASIYMGKLILRRMNLSVSLSLEFITGLTLITIIKAVLLILIPQLGFAISELLYLIFGIIIYSIGLGMLIDSRYGTSAGKNLI